MTNTNKFNQTFTYEEAFRRSLNYFNNEDLPAKVEVDKYLLRNPNNEFLESNPDQKIRRIAKEISRIEHKKYANRSARPMTEEEVYMYLKDYQRIIPQGSPMYGIGNEHQHISLGNCFVLDSPNDSYGSILKTDEELVQISKRRGGVGIDISNIRPSGFSTKNASRSSTGVPSFMERYSNSIREVGQCLHGSTLVMTKEGLINISEIKSGDEVWTNDGWTRVLDSIHNEKPCIKIKTKNGREIICSKEHVFHSINGEKEAQEFDINDSISHIIGNEFYGKDVKLDLIDEKYN